jgi:dTDP-4-amino-4,6-dideoxygalactose transaminase
MTIGFNKPYLTGKEIEYITQSVASEKISGDGMFTKKCHEWFEEKYGFLKVLLTTSCTDALEMAAILADIKEGDEVIAPSYTFVSSVNAFVLRGAKIVFVDSCSDSPNMDAEQIEKLISSKTKAIIPVHYGGVACDMDKVMSIARKNNILVIEDAAQAIDSYYNDKPLGSIGHMAAFSFHETKNIISGEGGMLVINDERFIKRAEIIREKGTNRSAFFRGEIDKYNWVDIGSSFLPSDMIAAFLYAQIQNIEDIQSKRIHIWNLYNRNLQHLTKIEGLQLPRIPPYATNNAHNYTIACRNLQERTSLIEFLGKNGIQAVFHYLSLHRSPYFHKTNSSIPALPHADKFSDCLVRLPLYYELKDEQVNMISEVIDSFFKQA